jgi:HNH endonuclease
MADITDRTRKILWTRAADRCAICHCKLVQDSEHPDDREAVVGDECHIVPKAGSGTRSGQIPEAELHEYKNLILLCVTHHRLVDGQPAKYSVEVLREIKRTHEQWVDQTLDWRDGVPDTLWDQVKAAAESILAEHTIDLEDDGPPELLTTLGAFAFTMAGMLAAAQLVFYIRGAGGLAFAYKVSEGSVHLNSGPLHHFDAGFEAFSGAEASDDIGARVRQFREREGDIEPIDDRRDFIDTIGSALLEVAERTAGTDAVLYRRGPTGADEPELALKVAGDAVAFGAGGPGSFAAAHDAFENGNSVEMTKVVRLKMFVEAQGEALEEKSEGNDDAVKGFLANFLAVAAVLNIPPSDLGGEGDIDKRQALFAGLLRDRFFEALLVLRAAAADPDPRLLAYVAEHFDRDRPDRLGALSAVCRTAVREFAAAMDLDGSEEAALLGRSIDALEATLRDLDDFNTSEDARDSLARVALEGVQWWDTPQAGEEVVALVGGISGGGER